jgi:hypothetical protein
MATFQTARHKLLHHPIDLDPTDIRILRERDEWLAKSAVELWKSAVRWRDYRRKYPAPEAKRPLPVVKLGRSR